MVINVLGANPRVGDLQLQTNVTMRFPGERLATFAASFGAADIGRYTLVGTKGVLTSDPAYEYAEGLKSEIKVKDRSRKRTFPKRDQFAAELVYFSDCILKDKQPEPSGEEGMADVRIIEAIYKAARASKSVRLPGTSKKARPTLAQEIYRRRHAMLCVRNNRDRSWI
jgi:predicted dehydrogenase